METAGLCGASNDPIDHYEGGSCLWFNQGCGIGCSNCTGTTSPCKSTMQPTIKQGDTRLRTYTDYSSQDRTKNNPWRAPGYAPVENACGIAGGWDQEGAPGNGGYPPAGIKQGMLGTDLPEVPQEHQARWEAGSLQNVSWSITANHGGGYQYRLCPKSRGLTEDCFQDMPLTPVGPQYVKFGTVFVPGVDDDLDRSTRSFPAVRVSEGVKPAGSVWTRNPIPACDDPYGGAEMHGDCKGSQFKPMFPDLFGFGLGRCNSMLPGLTCSDEEYSMWVNRFNFNIIDTVEVPEGIEGEYVLSWRWDSEQTPQVWAGCSDVLIV